MKIKHIIMIIVVIMLHGNAYAWSDGEDLTHQKITNQAIKVSTDAQGYLVNNLKLPKQFDTPFFGQKCLYWLESGSREEDSPMCRASNHFHDPTVLDWQQAGLTTLGDRVTAICSSSSFSDWGGGEYTPDKIKSNVVWATGYTSSAPDGTKMENENDWDWDDARKDFYRYLTGFDYDNNDHAVGNREFYFSQSLQSLGKVMHLLQDMSVPAHTRNDFSKEFWTGHTEYQGWWGNKGTLYGFGEDLEVYAATNQKDSWFNADGGIPDFNFSLTDFWDKNVYNETNPEVTWNENVGLSEFTNANFISESTANDYNYPAGLIIKGWNNVKSTIAIDGVPENRLYLSRTQEGFPTYLVATPSLLTADLNYYAVGQLDVQRKSLIMDDEVLEDYAGILIPKTVKYSAGLINYFFRGDIDLEPDLATGHGFIIRNNSDELMTSGGFEIYYDNQSDIRRPIFIEEAPSVWTKKIYKNTIEPGETSSHIDFWPEPNDIKEPGKYTLVFKGTMGLEKNAVVGKVIENPIKISLPEDGYYAFTDRDYILDPDHERYLAEPSTDGFTKMIMNVENMSDKEMSGGNLKLTIKYRLGQGEQFQTIPADTSDVFDYITSDYGSIVSLPKDDPSNTPLRLEFDISSTPLPLWATDVSIYLLYQGSFGEQQDALCIGLKDISEPTAFGIISTQDKVCLYNELIDSGSDAAKGIGDLDGDGTLEWAEVDIFPHKYENIQLWFSNNKITWGSPISCDPLNPGELVRFFLLTDYKGGHGRIKADMKKMVFEDNPFPNTYSVGWTFDMIGNINQLNKGYWEQCPETNPACLGRFAGQHYYHNGISFYVPVLLNGAIWPDGSICEYED